ncbi:hypothetical protein XELAEV_18030594mg [Xenopus laevis]|uniref:Uncharacterized protein n=1 Tax=Xenopus laevis TaxID=8355 RepID=A0A974CL15_XENLA|nr:hypothetical protein XELAEV_18030594mg [Xenopus laevis]
MDSRIQLANAPTAHAPPNARESRKKITREKMVPANSTGEDLRQGEQPHSLASTAIRRGGPIWVHSRLRVQRNPEANRPPVKRRSFVTSLRPDIAERHGDRCLGDASLPLPSFK